MDFVHDETYDGTKLRILTVIDTHSRFVPTLDVRRTYKGADVVDTLERVCKEVGYPKTIRGDQGSEFISKDLDLWAYQRDATFDFSRPGKTADNAFIKSLNGRFRAERLNTHWFTGVSEAQQKCDIWPLSANVSIRLLGSGRDYNEFRPHQRSATSARSSC